MKAIDWVKRYWQEVALGVLVVTLFSAIMIIIDNREKAITDWRAALFAATTPTGINDFENSEAIRAFSVAYGDCLRSPSPSFDKECLEWAINRMEAERSEAASPERVQAEREAALKLFTHVTSGDAATP